MSQKQWLVHASGKRLTLTFSDNVLLVGGGDQEFNLPPEAWPNVSFPNAYCALLPLTDDESVQVGFTTRDEQKAFARELEGQLLGHGLSTDAVPRKPRPKATVALYTIARIPGRRIVEAMGMVTSESVMSRGMFSDTGSDLKSIVGGNLVGMERAVREATERAKASLAESARQLGGDAVIGVAVSIAGVGDKAEAIVMAGTAVRTTPEADQNSPSSEVGPTPVG